MGTRDFVRCGRNRHGDEIAAPVLLVDRRTAGELVTNREYGDLAVEVQQVGVATDGLLCHLRSAGSAVPPAQRPTATPSAPDTRSVV